MKLRLSGDAKRDLQAIARQGALRFGLLQSKEYAQRIARALDTIRDMPEIAHVRAGYPRPIRVHPVGVHLIVYEVKAQTVMVVRVLHGRQNLIDHI